MRFRLFKERVDDNPFLEQLDGRYGRMMISKYRGNVLTVDSRHYDFCDTEDFTCIREKIEERMGLEGKVDVRV